MVFGAATLDVSETEFTRPVSISVVITPILQRANMPEFHDISMLST
jgi:hypothetical protein